MMKKFLTATAVMLAMFSTTSVKAAYILDPTFSMPTVANYQYNPTSTAWTFTGQSGIANGSSPGNAFGATTPPVGTQVAFLQSNAGGTGVITQSVTTAPTGLYTLSFYAETRAGYPASSFTVSIAGLTETFSPTTSGSYTLYTSYAVALTGPATLSFTALSAGANTDSTSFITGVSLNTIPEPASVGMLGLGLIASAGFAVRKARRNRN